MSAARQPDHRTTQARERDDLVALLSGDGCLVCRRRAEARARWQFTFVTESHAEPDVLVRVAAAGFCPRHHRDLLGDKAGPWLLPTVYELVAVEARRRLQAGTAQDRPDCPACAHETTMTDIILARLGRTLNDPQVAAALTGPGAPCLPHLRRLWHRIDARQGRIVVASLRDRLEHADAAVTLTVLGGLDPDVAWRDRTRRAGSAAVLTDERDRAGRSMLELVAADLG